MNEIKYALRRLMRGGSLNLIKIISLGLGFAISFILLSKVAYELSFDSYIKDSDQVYRVITLSNMSGKDKEYERVSGAVAPGMKKEIPQVVAATRWTGFTEDSKLYTDDNRGIAYIHAVLADEHYFDIFDSKIISGDPMQVLTQKMYCMISDELAAKIGGDVIGKQFQFKDYPEKWLTIGGVFEHQPSNATFRQDILVAMPSIDQFTWDGSENWIGNDRYNAFVKLAKETDLEAMKKSMRKMQQKYQDIEKIEREYNAKFSYLLVPIRSVHLDDDIASTSVLLIGIIGLIVLIMSLLNYLLLRITSIVNSSKSIGIRKSMGAEKRDIRQSIFADTIVHLTFALIVGLLFILVFKKSFSYILDISLSDILTPYSLLIGVGLLLLSGVLISFGPGRIMATQSLIHTIRDHQRTNRRWKLVLLFIEGVGVSFLLSTVYFVHRQYDHTMHIDKGYDVTNVYHMLTASVDSLGIKNITTRLRSMPEVELVSLATTVPYAPDQSGDNFYDPETGKENGNVSDYFWCDKYYFDIFRIPIVEGEGFDTAPCNSKSAFVNESMARRLIQDFGWKDGVVGKELYVTSHDNPMTIRGVMADFRTNRFGKTFLRDESVVIAGGAWYRYSSVMLVRFKTSDLAAKKKAEGIINEYSRFGDIELVSAEEAVKELFVNIRNLGHYTVFGSIIALIIALIGIVGYTEEEISRRRKEIAIRKVNGASFRDIVELFLLKYLKVGIPATLLGLALAFIAIQKWVESLIDQITLPVYVFFLIGIGVLLLTCIIMTAYCYFTANRNPTKYLSEE